MQIKENIKAPCHRPLWGIDRWPVNSPHKWPVMLKMFPFDDIIMIHFVQLMIYVLSAVIAMWTAVFYDCSKDYKRCINISYHTLDFCSTEKEQIHNAATLYVAYSILSIPCLLMPWWLKSPGHQQAWYWPNKLVYSVASITRVERQIWMIK